MKIENIKTENKNLEVEIKEFVSKNEDLQKKLVTCKDIKEVQKILSEIENNNNTISENKDIIENNLKKIERIKKDEREYEKIKDLSIQEIEEKIKNKELKLSKKRIKELQKFKTVENLESNKNIKKCIKLYANQQGNIINNGFLIQIDNNYYCIARNHIAIKGILNKDELSFRFNPHHEKFRNTNCITLMKQYFIRLFELLDVDINNYLTYKVTNKTKFETVEENTDQLLELFSNCIINIKTNEYTNLNYEKISINKEIDDLISKLEY